MRHRGGDSLVHLAGRDSLRSLALAGVPPARPEGGMVRGGMGLAPPGGMERKPRWAEMCARILQQCEVVVGGRENLARYLDVHPYDLGMWIAAKGGPPRAVFEKAMEIILAEHDRRGLEEAAGRTPRRRAYERK